MKYAENLVDTIIVKYTGQRLGTEVEFRDLVCFVILVQGARYKCAAAAGEKKKERNFKELDN